MHGSRALVLVTTLACFASTAPSQGAGVPADPIAKHPEWDASYTEKIRSATTGPEFMTDLVDHLPASTTVPNPEKANGYIAGAPDHLTYAEDVHRYMRALAAASPRVRVFSIGKTEEGREMILVAISDEATIAKLDEYKNVTKRLADPRKLSAEEAEKLIATGKPMYYMTGAMHSPETGSPEMFMELAYRLAVEETPFVQAIRKNVITLITPVLEVDGRDRMVDVVRYHQAHPESPLPPLAYWGHYVAHDNNRDAMGMALKLTRNVLGAYFDWHPQVIHDFHESIPFLYVSTGTGPYNPALDPITVDEWQRMAYNETQTLTEKGLVGVWTHGFYDGWAPNYMIWVAQGHNSVGRFYETFGNLVPATEDRVVRGASQRDWFRPNPPYPKVRWALRNNTNYQQSGALVALKYLADNREHALRTFWNLGRRALAKADNEGPAAYVFPADQKRRGQMRDLLLLLRDMGIEIQRTDQAASVEAGWPPKKKAAAKAEGKPGEDTAAPAKAARSDAKKPPTTDAKDEKKPDAIALPAGSFVIRMDQPYSRFADTLLDTQYVLAQEKVYDDTGWTLGYTKNVDVHRIVNLDVLKIPMHPWDGTLSTPVKVGTGKVLALANHADTDLVRLRVELPQVRFAALEEEVKQDGATLSPGTILVDATDATRAAIARYGSFTTTELAAWPHAKLHDAPLPRIALLHTWLDTQDEGWFRLAFESLKVPYDYLSTQKIADLPDLRAKYDVIVFPPAGGEPVEIVNGLPPGPPLPWKKTSLTPNLGVDQTDDMRPGLGLGGVANLQRFVEEGGLLIAVRDAAVWAVQYGLARYVTVVPEDKLRAPGTILRADVVDAASPITYGYDATVAVHYAGSPIFRVGQRAPQRNDRRPSGRGSKSDPDVPQGRAFVETPERPKPGPGEQGFERPEDQAVFAEPYIPRIEDRPRVVLAFPKEADDLLLSGMLDGGDEIAGTPVVIDSPCGKGHILLFADNPMWRMNTQGDYALVFNAILNAGHLGLGWPPAAKEKPEAAKN
jgi:hypothetical protein